MQSIKAIIGLGNPGQSYYQQRHSIGFRVLDELARKCDVTWQTKGNLVYAEITSASGAKVILVKPLTFMNSSGQVMPFLQKQGVAADTLLVVHDELELPFGKLAFKTGGSAKGHNGLKSIIVACGAEFHRLRFGIGRPVDREQVPDYVLKPFSEKSDEVDRLIDEAVVMIEELLAKN